MKKEVGRRRRERERELTKVFLGLVCLIHSQQSWLQNCNGRHVMREDTKRSSRGADVHLLHVHAVVERLERKERETFYLEHTDNVITRRTVLGEEKVRGMTFSPLA